MRLADGHPLLARVLDEPPLTVALADVPAFWRRCNITFVFRRPPLLEDGDWLPAAIRGALGRQLKRLAETREWWEVQGAPERRGGPSALDALYRNHAVFAETRHVPKPFVIGCKVRAERVRVRLSLFGHAIRWREDVMRAMHGVMQPRQAGGEGGIALRMRGRARAPWPLVDAWWQEEAAFPLPPPKPSFLLVSRTPVVAGVEGKYRGDMADLWFSLVMRVAGLARWQGLKAPVDEAHWRALCRRVKAEHLHPPRPSSYVRRSRRHPLRDHHMRGVRLNLLIRDCPRELWPVFALGVTCHMGGDAALGHGRYIIGDP